MLINSYRNLDLSWRKSETDAGLFSKLPNEIIKQFFSHFSLATLGTFCKTNKNWNWSLNLEKNSDLWKEVFFLKSDLVDPVVRLKEMGFVGLSFKGSEVIRKMMAERSSPLKEELKKRSLPFTNGLLLSGPSGVGKTMLAKSLSILFDVNYENIQVLSGLEIFNKWEEKSEANVKELFLPSLISSKEKSNKNNILLLAIDDFHVLLSKNKDKQWMHAVVEDFLVEMDNLKNSYQILVIGMTNCINELDETVISSNRFGEHIELAALDLLGRKKNFHLLSLDIAGWVLSPEIDFDFLAKETEGFTGTDISDSIRKALDSIIQRLLTSTEKSSSKTLLTMQDLHDGLQLVKKERGLNQ